MPATTKKTTKKNTDVEAVEEVTASTADVASGDTNVQEKVASKPAKAERPLKGEDEIAIASFVPYRVSYDDKATFDKYVWEGVGDVQCMTFDALTRMRRNHPGYFEDMELKPEDERAIKKLNLTGLYGKYEHLMNADAYSRDAIGGVVEEIGKLPNSAKITVVHKIKGMVESGELTDINVIRTIEKRLGIDLIAIL